MTAPTDRAPRPGARPLAVDGLDTLIDERDHLLRSLDDLEREHDAGDVDDTDYLTLRDDYTARAAAVIRSIEAKRANIERSRPRRSWRRTLAWLAVVVAFAVLAGVLVAQMSGTRRAGESATGSVRDSTRALLADATNALLQQRDLDDAISLYTAALDLAPANTEALTYRGWAQYLAGDLDAAMRDLDQAIDIDPDYRDARVFRTATLVERGEFADAAVDLRAFDELQPTQLMRQIVAQNFLRERVFLGVVEADDTRGFADAGFTADDAVAAAAYLAELGEPVDAIELIDQVLAAEPDHADGLALRGWVLARAGVLADDASVVARGLADLDAVLAGDPDHAGALVYRSFTLMFGNDDGAAAKASLDAFDALAAQPTDLVALIDGFGLRAAISEATNG